MWNVKQFQRSALFIVEILLFSQPRLVSGDNRLRQIRQHPERIEISENSGGLRGAHGDLLHGYFFTDGDVADRVDIGLAQQFDVLKQGRPVRGPHQLLETVGQLGRDWGWVMVLRVDRFLRH